MKRVLFRAVAALFAVAAMAAAGCSDKGEDDPQPPEPDTAVFMDNELTAPADGGDVVLRIKANKAWKLEMPVNKDYLHGELHAGEAKQGVCWEQAG